MTTSIAIILVALILLCCLTVCVIIFAAAIFIPFLALPLDGVEIPTYNTPYVETAPTAEFVRPEIEGTPVPISTDTLETLENAVVPVSDLRILALRLEGKTDIPETLPPPAAPLLVGAQQTFWMTNGDTNNSFQTEASLRYITDHVYFWIEDGVVYREDELSDLVETFENEIYPTDVAFFGSEWSPGIDGDPHIYILLASGAGNSIAGYYSSADEYHPLAHEFSNAHELFVLNADNIDLNAEFTYGVLAHEFQHMIHWYRDRNEETWMNEGFSEVATLLNGYNTGGFDYVYASNPDMQLTDWPGDGDTTPHYGASFLFLTYFLDRFGEEATKALVAHPNNGMSSIDEVLAGVARTDPLRDDHTPQADDVFQDWVIASYLQNDRAADGRYTYHNYPGAPQPDETETISACPTQDEDRDVHQYGADYILITCQGSYTLHFEGSTVVSVVPTEPHSGDYAFWSNRGDESDMTLTQMFDFTAQTGPLTLSYWTWYDLEADYDYLYLETSLDGESWQIVTTPSGTPDDPSGNSYGWAYNGQTNGWIQETIDLSHFAGQKVHIRFEYVTDAAVNGNGLMLDDISIPEIDYFTDFEDGNGGWEPAGFVRIDNLLPQTFRLALITQGKQGPVVQYIALSPGNTADISFTLGSDIDEAILVVSGTTRFTNQQAAYRFSITP